MATPRLRLVHNIDGIPTVREVWQGEIERPDKEQLEREREIEDYFRNLASMYESKAAEITALRDHARKLGEQAEILQHQVAKQEREQARIKEEQCKLEREFRVLAEKWYLGTMFSSSYFDKILHPAYQKILTLGKAAVPFILRELQDMPNDWFWALRVITDEDPTTPEQAGDMEAMARAWLEWGKGKRYI